MVTISRGWALYFGLSAAVVADDVAKLPAAEAMTGRIEGRIKLPELPIVKTENEALKALAADSPQVRLHSVSLLVPNRARPPGRGSARRGRPVRV